MTIQDLFITPIYLILFGIGAYLIRPLVTTPQTKKYFLPALYIRFFGAIMLGVIYQFYYGGGDTFNYFTYGSRWIWEAFWDDPALGIQLLLEKGGEVRQPETFTYSQHIWFYRDEHSFFIVRLAAFFDLFTFHTYTATALFFAVFSFSGMWAMFSKLTVRYPVSIGPLAFAILFIPSVIFWGSGILKDSVTLGALGWMIYCFIRFIEEKDYNPLTIAVLLISTFLIYSIKIYILLCVLPGLFFWVYWKNIVRIKSVIIKVLMAPFLFALFAGAGFVSMKQVGEFSDRYSLDQIAQQAAVTSYDIRYGWGARTGGDGGYDLGNLDGTWSSMVRLMPQAIVVSLFRPFIWEVKNPLMLLSALEALMMIFLTLKMFRRGVWRNLFSDPFLIFCLTFSLLFAFAVGVSTANFGTLMRYKIPLLPYFLIVVLYTNGTSKLSEK